MTSSLEPQQLRHGSTIARATKHLQGPHCRRKGSGREGVVLTPMSSPAAFRKIIQHYRALRKSLPPPRSKLLEHGRNCSPANSYQDFHPLHLATQSIIQSDTLQNANFALTRTITGCARTPALPLSSALFLFPVGGWRDRQFIYYFSPVRLPSRGHKGQHPTSETLKKLAKVTKN